MIKSDEEPRDRVEQNNLSPREYYANLRALQRREWWAWGTSLIVMALLTLGVASLAIPSILQDKEKLWRSGTFQSVAGLVFLILLFVCYLSYEKILINRLRLELAERQFHSTLWRNLALVDPLTGLYNRRFAERRLKGEVSRSQRKGYDLTVLLFDLDNFKTVNDRYGHSAGDQLLKAFADRLSSAVRESDLAVRLGGDEFMLVLTECDSSKLSSVLKRLDSIEIELEGHKIPATFSVGWKQLEPGEDAQGLIDAADKALYADKGARKKELALTLKR